MNWRWLPNAITLVRIAMVLPLWGALVRNDYRIAFWLAFAAGTSDALDGFLARHFGWRSVLGGILDPIADKLLLSVCFLGLWWSGRLPGGLVALVVARDLVILLGAAIWWWLAHRFEPAPSFLSKLNTVVQIVLVMVVLAASAFRPLPPALLSALMIATAALTLASGVDYVVRYGKKAGRSFRSKP